MKLTSCGWKILELGLMDCVETCSVCTRCSVILSDDGVYYSRLTCFSTRCLSTPILLAGGEARRIALK